MCRNRGRLMTSRSDARRPQRVGFAEWSRDGIWRGHVEGAPLGSDVTVLFYETTEIDRGPRLHVHDYDETFIITEGRALFTIGPDKIEAGAGDVLFAPAHIPHKFHNLGPGRLRTTDIHHAPRWVQTDLPDPEEDQG